jgi:diguanylate cyclase (GGDEF)-like protein
VRLTYLWLYRMLFWSSSLAGRIYALLGVTLLAVVCLAATAIQLARLAAHTAKEITQDRGLSSLHAIDVEHLLRQADHLYFWIIGWGTISILLVGPVSLFIVARATGRLRGIARSMFRLARNDLTPCPPVDTRHDEIGAMARAVAAVGENERALVESRRLLEDVNVRLDVALNNMRHGLSMFDADQRLVLCNDTYRRMYDLPPDLTQAGTSLVDLIRHRSGSTQPGDEDGFRTRAASYRSSIAAMTPHSHALTMGDGRIIDVSLQPLKSGGWVAVHQDITNQRRAEAHIHRLARQDILTSLDNRRGFIEALDARFALAPTGQDLCFAVHAIDLDNFKDINDTYGHATGDALLEAVAARLQNAIQPDDLVARLGGDEFAIIQANVHGFEQASELAEGLVKSLSTPFDVRDQTLTVGASVGIALSPVHGRSPCELLQHADMALYKAKAVGRRTHSIFDVSLAASHAERKSIERDLADAVKLGQIQMYYQPIVSLADLSVIGCEALMRWEHPTRGFVSPADFIPVAETTGMINALGQFAIETAIADAAMWPSSMGVAVNLSPSQVASAGLVGMVRQGLARTGFAGHRLELEVTETVLLGDDDTTLNQLHALHDLGINIALDDFGTGYSSLRYLRSFPFDKLKIDRSFIHDLTEANGSAAIVGAVTSLARSLQMSTVAEGVETEEHLALVHAAGCTAAQGYLFSKPVPASELPAVFAACTRRAMASGAGRMDQQKPQSRRQTAQLKA